MFSIKDQVKDKTLLSLYRNSALKIKETIRKDREQAEKSAENKKQLEEKSQQSRCENNDHQHHQTSKYGRLAIIKRKIWRKRTNN